MRKLLLGWRMGDVASSDPLCFVVPDWLRVVNMEVTAVGYFFLFYCVFSGDGSWVGAAGSPS